MATSCALPLPLPSFQPFTGKPEPAPRPSPSRRKTSPQQGRALEVLGHAIEYLVDSRLFDQWESAADAEAVHLLMACSRSVFADGKEVFPWHLRVQRALAKRWNLHSSPVR